MTLPPDCPRQPEAGAYLLGALDPAERADYAEHLTRCQQCLREIGQLAGLPGLLAHRPVPPPTADTPSPTADAPPRPAGNDPVAAALAEIRRERTLRRTLVAAAFVLVAGLGVGTTAALGGVFGPTATGVVAAAELPVAMQQVGGAPVSAALELTAHPWGTEVVMRCRYRGSVDKKSPVYTLVATAADGTRTELARWTAIVDQDVVLATATELPMPDLAALEVHNAAGIVVLRTE